MNVWPQCCRFVHIIKDGTASCGAVRLGHQRHEDGILDRLVITGNNQPDKPALQQWTVYAVDGHAVAGIEGRG